ncbi:scavenger receptor class F member 1 [Scleropages formosus]|uniref:scavenger receptor class F member 1 n=1 Tax=Scleropages formosus TaxID=113540 RepID=UPI0010FA73E6|nr:scavenger receptor class F member 1 [Scleropages formosus]
MSHHLIGFGLLFCCLPSSCQKLDPEGKNVCLYPRDPTARVCCSGWQQEGSECTKPVCEGEGACQPDEICVFPGVCRCKHGFFGARCKTPCPPEFWGPDCRELCQCHPHGRCHPKTGKCTCLPNRWGDVCQNACRCGRHGRCDPVYGNCTCDEGWWTPTCSRSCLCNRSTSTCDPTNGSCFCTPNYWGPRCTLPCDCYISPCTQSSGTCQCLHGWWGPQCDRRCNCNLNHSQCNVTSGECMCHPGFKGPFCNEPCRAGYYGAGCEKKCGRCQEEQPCSVADGFCAACEPGWNGTRCDQPCPPGYHGYLCQEACPRCRNGEPCDPRTGRCSRCDPGRTGQRCESICANGTYGDGCRFPCSPCFHGRCDHVTGSCVCRPGFQGESCNSSCPDHLYGVNCSSACDCGGNACHPGTGQCHYSSRGALIAGLLVPLLLLLLALICCCCCCAGGAGKDRVAVGDGGTAVRMKHHVYSVLANVSSAMPCLALWSSGLPRVTVSHHDPELTFNHSFIEPPSSGWVSDNSSFESEDGEALYCTPPREDISAVAGGEFQELSSKCNMFPDPSGFSSEDMSLPFSIPRTSSIAKAKRPSVSFAEGTKFAPKERRGSAQEALGAARKPKSPWGVLAFSMWGEGELEAEREVAEGRGRPNEEPGEDVETRHQDLDQSGSASSRSSVSVPGGRPRTLSNARRHVQHQTSSDPAASDTGADKITTVYVTVNRPHGRSAKTEPSVDGPVQAVLRRLGSLQRQREEGGRPKGRGDVVVAKPPRRKLGARVSMWEQAAAGVSSEVNMRKPSRRKHTPLSSPGAMGSEPQQDSVTPRRPLSSILTSVPENTAVGPDGGAPRSADSQAAGSATDSEALSNEGTSDDGPSYENVMIKHS